MAETYLLDCSGFCRSVWEVRPPDSYLFAGLAQHWLFEQGWSRSKTLAWICPDCTRQEEKDHEEEPCTRL